MTDEPQPPRPDGPPLLPEPPAATSLAGAVGIETGPTADPSPAKSRKGLYVGLAVLAVIIVAAIGVGAVLLLAGGKSTDQRYTDALKKAGLSDGFTADRAAIANAHATCDRLDGGAKDQGSEADRTGVQYYCKDYLANFKVLEKQTILGSFTITSASGLDPEFASSGSCSGDGGYGDLNSSTAVVVKSKGGDELVRGSLGAGRRLDLVTCRFEFKLDLTEGEDTYIVSVGKRGEISYSWDQLKNGELTLSIGS